MIAQILVHLDGDAAVLIGLSRRSQILIGLRAVMFLVVGQREIGQLLVAVKLERVGPLVGDIGELLGGSVRPLQSDHISVAAHGAGTGGVGSAHGKGCLRSAQGVGEAHPGSAVQAGGPAGGIALVKEVILSAVREPGAGRKNDFLIG